MQETSSPATAGKTARMSDRLDLVPLDLAAAPLVNRYLAAYPPEVSELTFTNLFAWRRTRPVWLWEVAETLIFLIQSPRGGKDEMVIFGPPAGPLHLHQIFERLAGTVTSAVRQTATGTAGLSPEQFTVTADRDNHDYVYRVADLATLAGRNYSAKRNQVKQCLRNNQCRFELIDTSNLAECRGLLTRWCDVRQCEMDRGLRGEWTALGETLDRFLEFELFGGAIRIGEKLEAFAIGERLNRDTAVCHYEKALPGIQGLTQLINHWFAANCLRDFTYINREQDLGLPGLRQAKESYHPHHLVEKFTVTHMNGDSLGRGEKTSGRLQPSNRGDRPNSPLRNSPSSDKPIDH